MFCKYFCNAIIKIEKRNQLYAITKKCLNVSFIWFVYKMRIKSFLLAVDDQLQNEAQLD